MGRSAGIAPLAVCLWIRLSVRVLFRQILNDCSRVTILVQMVNWRNSNLRLIMVHAGQSLKYRAYIVENEVIAWQIVTIVHNRR